MIPAGRYQAVPTKAELGETSTGKEQVGVEFEITTAGEHTGHRVVWFGFFTEKTTERTIESLRVCGWTGTDITDLTSVGQASPVVELVIDHEEYNGKVTAKVQWVNRAGGLQMKTQLAPAKKAVFAQRMRGAIAAVDHGLKQGGFSPPQPRSSHGEPPPHGDDDIPF